MYFVGYTLEPLQGYYAQTAENFSAVFRLIDGSFIKANASAYLEVIKVQPQPYKEGFRPILTDGKVYYRKGKNAF